MPSLCNFKATVEGVFDMTFCNTEILQTGEETSFPPLALLNVKEVCSHKYLHNTNGVSS